MHATDWIIAGAAVASVCVAAWYTYITRKLLLATKESVDLTRRIYEGAHRPMVGIEVVLGVKAHNDGSVDSHVAYRIKNFGQDKASLVAFEVKSALDSFHHLIAVGDLQPGDSREITRLDSCLGPIVKAWNDEVNAHGYITFHALVSYSWADRKIEDEALRIDFTPDHAVKTHIKGGSSFPA